MQTPPNLRGVDRFAMAVLRTEDMAQIPEALRQRIRLAAQSSLPPDEWRVVALLYGIGDPPAPPADPDQAAGTLGLTLDQVRQREHDALEHVRDLLVRGIEG